MKRLEFLVEKAEIDNWLASRITAVTLRAHKKEVFHFFTDNIEILIQLGYIRINTPINVIALVKDTDQMLDVFTEIEQRQSVLPDQVFVLSEPITTWQMKHADYVAFVGSVIPKEIENTGYPIIQINPYLKETTWRINGKTTAF